jgi:predicted nucleic acid-binding protein
MLYLDTSAVLKLYLREPGSVALREDVKRFERRLFTSRVTYSETIAGLARVHREHRLTRQAYREKRTQFESDWITMQIVEVRREVLQPCAVLIERYALRGFDAIHLCSAVWLDVAGFACFDERLRSAAQGEGLSLVPAETK